MPYRGARFRGGESHLPHRLPLTARARFAPTAGVVLFREAAALHTHGGKGEGQEIRAERGGAALTGIGDVLPAGDIQPAAAAVLFGSGIELHIAPAVPQLRVEPQHGAQGGEAVGQQGADAALLDAVSHDELFNVHAVPPFHCVG